MGKLKAGTEGARARWGLERIKKQILIEEEQEKERLGV